MRASTALTPMQVGIIKDVALSKTRKQISLERGIIVQGVDYHLLKIYRKLKLDPNLDPRALLTLYAVKENLIKA